MWEILLINVGIMFVSRRNGIRHVNYTEGIIIIKLLFVFERINNFLSVNVNYKYY